MKSSTMMWLAAAAGVGYYLYKQKAAATATVGAQASTVAPTAMMATAADGSVLQATSPFPVTSQVINYNDGYDALPQGWVPMFGSRSWAGYGGGRRGGHGGHRR